MSDKLYTLNAEKLNKILYQNEMSYFYIANYLSISEFEFKCYMKNTKSITQDKVLEICKMLKVNIEDIINVQSNNEVEKIKDNYKDLNIEKDLDSFEFEN